MGISAGPKITTDGLVLHLDSANTKSYSGSGITIYNMVTGGIAGTLVNGPVSDIAYKKTFILDGTNDTIQMQLPSGLVTGSQISISFWAKWKTIGTTTATIQTLVDNQYQVADNIGFFIQDRPDLGSVLEWSTQPNNTVDRRVYSTQVVGDGSWHHIVGTNDGTYSRLYVDGYETGTAKTSAGIATTQDILCIGNWAYVYSSPRYLKGSISNFKVYSRALTSKEILEDYFSTKKRFYPEENIVTNGLVLNIDPSKSNSYSGTGNTIYDLSGFGNTGTLNNNPSFSAFNGGGFIYNGSNHYINFKNSNSLTFSDNNQISLAAWIYTTTTAADKFIFYRNSTSSTGYVFYLKNSGLAVQFGNGTTLHTIQSGISVTSGYFYVAATLDGSLIKLYVNGASIASTTFTGTLYNTAADISIGAANVSTRYFDGNIYSAYLYNRALSATEISQNFNATRNKFGI
jgi:hypothetical protein